MKRPVRTRRPTRKRIPNPEGVVSRIYYTRLADKGFEVTEETLTGHLYMAESANDIAKALAAFQRSHAADARLLTADEWDALATAERILKSVTIPRSTFTIVERRGPPKNYPGSRR